MATFNRSASAVVISTRPIGESDLLVHLFTLEYGRLTCIARGARRSRKRFMNALELFTQLSVRLARSRTSSMWRLDSASILNCFEHIRADYSRYVYGNLCLELVNLWQKEAASEPGIYALLDWYLHVLSRGISPVFTTIVFQVRLLKSAGVLPCLSRCSACGKAMGKVTAFVNMTTGELACSRCSKGSGSLSLSPGTLKVLERISSDPLDRVVRLRLTQMQVQEAWEYMRQIHCANLQRQPCSYKFINLQ